MTSRKLFLLLQTAIADPFLALVENDQLLSCSFLPNQVQLTETLVPTIHELLNTHQKKLSDIASIAVCQGPGSFTGMRIGLSVAQALCYAQKIPMIGFSSLECFTSTKTGLFTVALDARSGGVYYGVSSHTSEKILPKKSAIKDFTFEGDLLSPYGQALIIKRPDLKDVLVQTRPNLEHLAHLICRRYKKNLITTKLNLYYLSNPS